MGTATHRQELLALLLRYLRQPSTWQGLTLGFGSLAAWLGVPVETVTSFAMLGLALILVMRDERTPTEIVKDALGKALDDKVDQP